MTLPDFITLDNGISVAINALVIYVLYSMVKKAPKIAEKLILALENSSDAIQNNNYIIKDLLATLSGTQSMHEDMQNKISVITWKLGELENLVGDESAEFKSQLKDIKAEIMKLNKAVNENN